MGDFTKDSPEKSEKPNKVVLTITTLIIIIVGVCALKPVRILICEYIGFCYQTCNIYTGKLRLIYSRDDPITCEREEASKNRAFIKSIGLDSLKNQHNHKGIGKACFSVDSDTTECK